MPYWQLFYHLVWATKHREPLITPTVAPEIYGFLRSKAIGLGATVFAVNGVADHVHMVVAIPPRRAVATFIGQVKGVASASSGRLATPTQKSARRGWSRCGSGSRAGKPR